MKVQTSGIIIFEAKAVLYLIYTLRMHQGHNEK